MKKNCKKRQAILGEGYTEVAEAHNALGITESLDTATNSYFNRPYKVIYAGHFSNSVRAKIDSSDLKVLPLIGSVSHFSQETVLYDHPILCNRMKILYE